MLSLGKFEVLIDVPCQSLAVREAVIMGAPVVAVKLDISGAYDSLKISAVLQWLAKRWSSSTGKSAKVIQHILSHSTLVFHLFDQEWTQVQSVGTQQGATHSPVLFSYLVSDRFDVLTESWEADGESPPFYAGPFSMWGIWFVDDTTLFFLNPSQFGRLMPTVVSTLASLGLRINVKKTCTLGLTAPGNLECLPGLPHELQARFVGIMLRFQDDDTSIMSDLMRRAMAAYVSNKILLGHLRVSRRKRLQMFSSLVTSAIRWLLCVVPASDANFRKLRVGHVTLISWMLRVAAHFSNPVPEGISHSRHACKLWLWCYSERWDHLHARMVWDWAGHVFRRDREGMMSQAVLHFRSSVRLQGARAARTGPQNFGHRRLLSFLEQRGIQPVTAHDRQLWASYLPDWLSSCGMGDLECRYNVQWVSESHHLGRRWRDVQGTFLGQEIWIVSRRPDGTLILSTLRRCDGWLHWETHDSGLMNVCAVVVTNLLSRTFSVRLLIAGEFQSVCKAQCPCFSRDLAAQSVVVEVSSCPMEWARRMREVLRSF